MDKSPFSTEVLLLVKEDKALISLDSAKFRQVAAALYQPTATVHTILWKILE